MRGGRRGAARARAARRSAAGPDPDRPRARAAAYSGRRRWSRCSRLAVATVAFDLPDRFDEQRKEFVGRSDTGGGADLRARLTTITNNGRLATWHAALDSAKLHPWRGSGAGTYQVYWERYRPFRARVIDAHSLYFEVRAELGWIGVVLLAIAIGVPLALAASRLAGPGRHAYAAFLAGGIALLLHAATDWDWEMPVLFVWFFGAAGVVLALPVERATGLPAPRRLTRLLAGLACLLVAVTPVTVAVSQLRLNRSVSAFNAGDCVTATDAALDSLQTRWPCSRRPSRCWAGATRAPGS